MLKQVQGITVLIVNTSVKSVLKKIKIFKVSLFNVIFKKASLSQ